MPVRIRLIDYLYDDDGRCIGTHCAGCGGPLEQAVRYVLWNVKGLAEPLLFHTGCGRMTGGELIAMSEAGIKAIQRAAGEQVKT